MTIHLLFTGGTISMRRDPVAGGHVPARGGEELLALAPGVGAVAEVRVEDWARMPACHLDAERLWALRERVRAVADGGAVRGVVITHGTDTLEETAYLLARTLDPGVPVVLTGAMRTAEDPDWDGGQNLTDAVRVAADPASAGRGALVVFAGLIFDGLYAVKTDAVALAAFGAPHAGPIGRVDRTGVRYDAPPPRRTAVQPSDLRARVALVATVLGDDGALIEAARPAHDGLVLVAFGSGNAPPGVVPAVSRWIEAGKPVVLASRCATGQVTPLYAFDGGGAKLVALGAIPAGPRAPSQARMELAIALSATVRFGAG